MLFDCIFRAFFTKKTAKIAQEVWNLFQNVQKNFTKVRGRYEKRLETSGGVKMMKSAKNCQTAPPPLGGKKQTCPRKKCIFTFKYKKTTGNVLEMKFRSVENVWLISTSATYQIKKNHEHLLILCVTGG